MNTKTNSKPIDIASLNIPLTPISPDETVGAVGELFLDPKYQQYLSLPVVENGKPVGIITRYQLTKIFVKMYGRELYGRQPISKFMTRPLVVRDILPIGEGSQYISQHIQFPIMEDFVIVDEAQQYLGVGIVLNLLNLVGRQLGKRTQQLARTLRDLKESQAQLLQSEKMASLGQMVAGVAHEINTPLGYVRNNIELMESMFTQARDLVLSYNQLTNMLTAEDTDEDTLESQLELVATLSEPFSDGDLFNELHALFKDSLFGVDQISELVHSLKDFSRLDRAATANVDINECLDSCLVIGKNVIKNKAEIIKEYGEVPKIDCMPSQLNQVFLNLITNAAQAMPATEKLGTITLRTTADQKNVYVDVEDTGKGIPPDILPKIFDPFFTTKPIGEGTGLGLSISFKIIESHRGKIDVSSEVGKGTRFRITLPQRPSQPTPAA